MSHLSRSFSGVDPVGEGSAGGGSSGEREVCFRRWLIALGIPIPINIYIYILGISYVVKLDLLVYR